MMSGFSLFSFDLFGLFRTVGASRALDKEDNAPTEQGDIHFFGMFPVL